MQLKTERMVFDLNGNETQISSSTESSTSTRLIPETTTYAVIPDSYLASSSEDREIKIRNDGRLIRTLDDAYTVYSLGVLQNGLASSSWDNKIKVWNTGTGGLIRTEHNRHNC